MASVPTYNPSWWVGGISDAHYKLVTSKANHDPLLNRAIDGSLGPRVDVQARDRDRGAERRPAGQPRLLHQRPGLSTRSSRRAAESAPTTTTPTTASTRPAWARSTSRRRSRPRTTCSSTPSVPTTGTTRRTYGQTPIQKVAEKYGFGQPTGIDLPNEYPGQVDSPQLRQVQYSEYPKDFLELVLRHRRQHRDGLRPGRDGRHPAASSVAYGTFANGGTRYAPQVVNSIVSPSGQGCRAVQATCHGPCRAAGEHLRPDSRRARRRHLLLEPARPGHGLRRVQGLQGHAARGEDRHGHRELGSRACSRRRGSSLSARRHLRAPRYVVAVVIDQAGYGAAAAAPVARQIFEYLTAHPIGAAGPPSSGERSLSRTERVLRAAVGAHGAERTSVEGRRLPPRMTTPRPFLSLPLPAAATVVTCFVLFAIADCSCGSSSRRMSRKRRQRTCSRCQSRHPLRAHRRAHARRRRSTDAIRAVTWRDLEKGSPRCRIRRPAARRLYRTRPNARLVHPRRRTERATPNRAPRCPPAQACRPCPRGRRSATPDRRRRAHRPCSRPRLTDARDKRPTPARQPSAGRALTGTPTPRSPLQDRRPAAPHAGVAAGGDVHAAQAQRRAGTAVRTPRRQLAAVLAAVPAMPPAAATAARPAGPAHPGRPRTSKQG